MTRAIHTFLSCLLVLFVSAACSQTASNSGPESAGSPAMSPAAQKITSESVVKVAAQPVTIPADICLLTLAGSGCAHDRADICENECDEAHHDEHDGSAPDSDSHHHERCVTIPSTTLLVHAQHVPAIDLHQPVAPLVFVNCADGLAVYELANARRGFKPPNSPLFLLTHSFLI